MAKPTVESLSQQGHQAVAKGDNDAARQFYKQALQLKPDAPDVHYGMATVCFLLDDLASAAHHFKEVTRLDSHRAGAHINLGAIYNRMDMLDESIASLRRGIQLDHNRSEGFYNLGIVYRRKGQIDLAIQAYREAVRINPRMSDAHYNIGNLYFEKGQHGMALAHYKQAIAARPNWDKALASLAECEEILKTGPPRPAAAAPVEAASAAPTAAGEKLNLDPHRVVDHDAQGGLLTAVHKATVESDIISRSFAKILETEIEPAIKDLSSCLMFPESSAHEVELLLHKFESAIAHMHGAQEQLNSSLERVHKLGDKLVRS